MRRWSVSFFRNAISLDSMYFLYPCGSINGFELPLLSFAILSARPKNPPCDPRKISAFIDRSLANVFVKSSAISGYFSFPVNLYPGDEVLQTNITLKFLRFSRTFVVHVVQPRVWPGVILAVSDTSHNRTFSPSVNSLSGLTGSNAKSSPKFGSCRPPFRNSISSGWLTNSFAFVSRLISAIPPAWS